MRLFVLVYGNVMSGPRQIFGPFATEESAKTWHGAFGDEDEYRVATMEEPDTFIEKNPPEGHVSKPGQWLMIDPKFE